MWLTTTTVGAVRAATQTSGDSEGWQIPALASGEVNPVADGAAVLAQGKNLYRNKCQRCHGVNGKGDGPDADSAHAPADLTDTRRASRNPDGVVFYKIWNGRAKPRMPAMKTDLSRTEVWTLVHYVKALRINKSPSAD